MTELEPCPFCGGNKIKMLRNQKRIGHNGLEIPVFCIKYYARCNKCYARGGTSSGKVLGYTLGLKIPPWAKSELDIYKDAIKKWNRRATDDKR